jgi:hypothetical protein
MLSYRKAMKSALFGNTYWGEGIEKDDIYY